jgi:hypothetical protein
VVAPQQLVAAVEQLSSWQAAQMLSWETAEAALVRVRPYWEQAKQALPFEEAAEACLLTEQLKTQVDLRAERQADLPWSRPAFVEALVVEAPLPQDRSPSSHQHFHSPARSAVQAQQSDWERCPVCWTAPSWCHSRPARVQRGLAEYLQLRLPIHCAVQEVAHCLDQPMQVAPSQSQVRLFSFQRCIHVARKSLAFL